MILDWLAFLILITLYLGFAWSPFVAFLRGLVASRRRGVGLALILLVPYLLLTLPDARRDLDAFLIDLLVMVLYLIVPAIISLYRPPAARALHPLDILAILSLWFPIEFGWLPEVEAVLGSGVSLPVPMLTAIPLAFLTFLVLRPLDGIGYTFLLTRSDFDRISAGLVAYTIVGVPLGLITGFLTLGLESFDLGEWLAMGILGYLFTALPEELLFRGVLQNQLHRRIPGEWPALLLGSLIFGLAHLNNATPGFPEPNWMYALMATLAGLAYGWTWRQTGKITASALVHATVNLVWSILLSGGE